MSAYRTEALNYHRSGRPGKIEVVSSKPPQDACTIALSGRDGSDLHIRVAPPGSVQSTCLSTASLDAWIPVADL